MAIAAPVGSVNRARGAPLPPRHSRRRRLRSRRRATSAASRPSRPFRAWTTELGSSALLRWPGLM